jgi:hypothetical protein
MAISRAAEGGPSAQVLRSITVASQRTGVPFGYLLNQAKMESGFNPAAKAPTSSATGLYQFTRQTWLATLNAHGAEHGLGWAADAIERGGSGGYGVADPQTRQAILDLRNNPDIAAAMAAELAMDNSSYLSQQLGRDITSTDLSLAHFLGAEGASKFLTALAASPDASAAPLFPEAAAANRPIFYDRSGAPRSLAEVHARFASKAGDPASIPVNVAATTTYRREYQSESSSNGEWASRVADIEPMPGRLSLSFAQSAYKRLAAMDSGE